MAPGIFFERFVELGLAKVRPERLRDDQFGIGNLARAKNCSDAFRRWCESTGPDRGRSASTDVRK